MLIELDSLSENINRLLGIVESSRVSLAERDAELAQIRIERDEALTANHALHEERDALREERDALLAKIEDAQVKLNAILEKLPRPRAPQLPEPDDASADDGIAVSSDAASAPHAEGETYER